jgi:hypothetical protein
VRLIGFFRARSFRRRNKSGMKNDRLLWNERAMYLEDQRDGWLLVFICFRMWRSLKTWGNKEFYKYIYQKNKYLTNNKYIPTLNYWSRSYSVVVRCTHYLNKMYVIVYNYVHRLER